MNVNIAVGNRLWVVFTQLATSLFKLETEQQGSDFILPSLVMFKNVYCSRNLWRINVSLWTDWKVDISNKKSHITSAKIWYFSSPCFNHDIKFYILNKSILELMKLWVKFTKCQAHAMLLRLDEKKRLDKIHISVRNGLTVKITQMFIFDSQPFFFYIFTSTGSIW